MAADQTTSAVWNDQLLADPHHTPDKRTRVQRMFAAIAPSYDLNNRVHSLWIDQRWRRRAVALAQIQPADVVVDVACGTGDLALRFAMARPKSVIGIDFTYEMLPLAQRKIDRCSPHRAPITLACGDAMRLPLPPACADVVSIAFGIRNVANPAAAVAEFYRVLRPGGRLIILEFSLPDNPLLRSLYNLYFRHVLPRTATLISGDKTGAYKYLPESVNTFIDRQTMMQIMKTAGFDQVQQHPLTFGVCICYRGVKPTFQTP
ncbi:MAG TPA: bifunctional demethylmenaquinone methyltransferase/2-methoxy-6-polyprenyl-1,4-benzoquinol methylase UbiE [Tepidisphaeraceae bacterium]|nr:bifunctional demethylmenaquinone methyltransferase/2-methoxy-6-polyprenyl-1,4-benzoquinol methylase UbiE [Tepidisphaeraceae bacterium]